MGVVKEDMKSVGAQEKGCRGQSEMEADDSLRWHSGSVNEWSKNPTAGR